MQLTRIGIMQRTSFAKMHCSLARGLDLIGDWWSPLIVRDLYLGLARFDELIENLGISRNLLTRRLKSLVRSGIVERKVYRRKPIRYGYALTEAGRDLVPAILALTAWGDRWARPKEGSPMLFVHQDMRTSIPAAGDMLGMRRSDYRRCGQNSRRPGRGDEAGHQSLGPAPASP